MVRKKAYFCHLHKNEWQVEQETNVFVFYNKFLISGHPWACQYNFCYCSGKDAGDIPHSVGFLTHILKIQVELKLNKRGPLYLTG